MNIFTEQIVPGTFFAIVDPKQMSAIELGISLGERIQKSFPEIVEFYKNGFSASMLVKHFSINSYFGVRFKIAESAVYCALKGYDGSMKVLDIKAYDGLITEEEYQCYAQENNKISGAKVGKEQFEKKQGIFAMSNEQKHQARMKLIIACGNVPYLKEELAFIEELAQKPEYIKKGGKVKVSEIAFEVNLKFHKGKEVRKPDSITKTRIRERKKLQSKPL